MAVSNGALIGAAAINSATSGGTSSGGSVSNSRSYSATYGTEASKRAAAAANTANTAANAAWQKAADYNAEEAAKQRAWLEYMANTTYQRTVKDMIKAGINPVLAANMGLSADSVSSGAQATMGNPMSYMANTYADSNSASESHGSSWNEASNGIALLAEALKGLAQGMNSALDINIALNGIDQIFNDNVETGDGKTVGEHAANGEFKKSGWEIIKETLSNPKELLENTLRYITTKNSGGMLKPNKK